MKDLSTYPHTQLSLFDKVEVPFADESVDNESPSSLSESAELDHLGFFPQLPSVRYRGYYVADGSKYNDGCNKYSHGHSFHFKGARDKLKLCMSLVLVSGSQDLKVASI